MQLPPTSASSATPFTALKAIEQADSGVPYQFEERWLKVALSREFNEPIFMDPWIMPRGAFGESCGPT